MFLRITASPAKRFFLLMIPWLFCVASALPQSSSTLSGVVAHGGGGAVAGSAKKH